jgi:glycosyltransferase involved in cell wall biosynthesis
MYVDIIIPSYHGTHLKETLDSCVNQTYKKINIIVVNNNSPFDIEKICKSYKNVQYIYSGVNLGPAGGRNLGISKSSSDFISFIDDDDIMCPTKIELSIAELKNNEVGLTCGNYKILYKNKLMNPFYKNSINIDYKMLLKQNFVASGSTTIKRDVINTVGLFNENFWIAEDYDYWLRISENYKVKYIHNVLYHYRINPGSNSLTQSKDIQKKHINNLSIIRESSIQRMNKK